MNKIWVGIALLVICTGCSGSVSFSVMKQWDRPAERTVVEDVMRSPEPKIQIKTQEPVRMESIPSPDQEVQQIPKAEPKQMNFEVPPIIAPKTPGIIKAYYIHIHGDEKKVCYVRKVEGIYAQNLIE